MHILRFLSKWRFPLQIFKTIVSSECKLWGVPFSYSSFLCIQSGSVYLWSSCFCCLIFFPPIIYLIYDLTEIENFYFEDKVSRWGIFNLYFFSTNRLIILLNVKRNSDVCKPIVLAPYWLSSLLLYPNAVILSISVYLLYSHDRKGRSPTDLVAYFSTWCSYCQYSSIFAVFPHKGKGRLGESKLT